MTVSEIVQDQAEVFKPDPGRRFREIFPGVEKPLIAMAHVPALPGTPLYNEGGGVLGLVRHVREEVAVLVDAGFDAVMFCNEHDRPYALKADLVASAVMARVVTECRPEEIPFGVDYLWDPECALATAVATEASFIREVASGAWESDMGNWAPDAAALLRHRRHLDAERLAIFMNVTPEFASTTGTTITSRSGNVSRRIEHARRHPHIRARWQAQNPASRSSPTYEGSPSRDACAPQHRRAARQHR